MAENDTDMAMVTDPATPRKQSEATPEATNFLGNTLRHRLASFCDPALTRIGAKHRQIVDDHRKFAQGLSKHLMPSLPSHLKRYHCRHDHAHAQHQPHQSSTPSSVFFLVCVNAFMQQARRQPAPVRNEKYFFLVRSRLLMFLPPVLLLS